MVQKFFLALDYPTDDQVVAVGTDTLAALRSEFGDASVREHVGVKINEDAFIGSVDERFREFPDNGIDVFADLKTGHGASTWRRILDRIQGPDGARLPLRYATAAAVLGPTILREYVQHAKGYGTDVIAFTAHTKTPSGEARLIYAGQNMDDIVHSLAGMAALGGCHAAVMEAERLRDPRIRNLPIRKLVTGVRMEGTAAGEQQRVTPFSELAARRNDVEYVVISSSYLKAQTRAQLVHYIRALTPDL